MNQALFRFISACPTAAHTAAICAEMLAQKGYTRLEEGEKWTLTPGKGYFTLRGGSSLLAFRVPQGDFTGFMIAAAHGDSPAFSVKENSELAGGSYVRLTTEKYGGMILSSWMDRPLSIAGRVGVKSEAGVEMRLADLKEPCAVMPNVAIHLNKNANSMTYDPAVDMLPLWRADGESGTFRARVAACVDAAEEDILSTELYLYNPQAGMEWNDLIAAPRLDDLQCTFAAISAFLDAKAGAGLPVFALFDHEEVGRATAQGAGSTFLRDVLSRICGDLSPEELQVKLANSFLLSCDNAHALHPNHGEFSDKNHAPVLNGGVVIKHSSPRRYTTSAETAALVSLLCRQAGVPSQDYRNRADLPGGSTLGAIVLGQLSIPAADIGLAQLSMHSSFETAGAKDTAYLKTMLQLFFEKGLRVCGSSFTLV